MNDKGRKKGSKNNNITTATLIRQFMLYLNPKTPEQVKSEKEVVLNKFNHKCVVCGATTNMTASYNKVSRFNEDRVENKFAMCQKCINEKLNHYSYKYFDDKPEALKLLKEHGVIMNEKYNSKEVIPHLVKQFQKIYRLLPDDILEIDEKELLQDERIKQTFFYLKEELEYLVKGHKLIRNKYKEIFFDDTKKLCINLYEGRDCDDEK